MKIINTENEWNSFLLPYTFAMAELKTKISIMNQEANLLKYYNPIEHINIRLKELESILNKLERKNLEPTLENAEKYLHDIIGIRITCCFEEDIYYMANLLKKRADLKVVELKDYIKNPKPNGYKSLHVIVKIPLVLSTRQKDIFAEIQLRTLAMDFWASLEHKLYYKHEGNIPDYLKHDLYEAAQAAATLDKRMNIIRKEINNIQDGYEQIFLPS
ncbi:GTP pyrophosphokinase [Bacillus canaveralius]|uniref:GTP pyrophosphokinase n=1 Tax=Bacillus canaveralius TaxID=1403243 RepID=A0A2N5GKY6_9BACI|nr:GTP pyrophosphokinase family protein [Bacillus canaveralius]PLR82183.1 GTP pyrophosphokinase [Bacillus canaveralius]PLR97911.1 GTP pyrophosphokinase [Bacillus canaveralius]